MCINKELIVRYRKDGEIQNSEKSSLVDPSVLPKIQSSTKLEDEKSALESNNVNGDPENSQNVNVNGSVVRQVLAALVAQLGTINTGMTFGFSAIALPQLQEPNSTIPIVEGSSEESWIGR